MNIFWDFYVLKGCNKKNCYLSTKIFVKNSFFLRKSDTYEPYLLSFLAFQITSESSFQLNFQILPFLKYVRAFDQKVSK